MMLTFNPRLSNLLDMEDNLTPVRVTDSLNLSPMADIDLTYYHC